MITSNLKNFFKSKTLKVYIVMICIYVVACLIQPNYFSFQYINMMLLMASFLGIASMGQTMVILTGGIDLSIPYALTFASCVLVQETHFHGLRYGLVAMFAVAIACGLFNGLGIAFLKIPPIVMTLATNSIFSSITLLYTGGSPTGNSPNFLKTLGTGNVFGVKIGVIVWLFLSILFIVMLKLTPFGRKIYTIGNSSTVSFLSGINGKAITVVVYLCSSIFAALAGALMTGYSGSAYLGMGDILQLQTVSAVVIGGTSVLGGQGGYLGTIGGVVTIYILNAILTVFNIAAAGRDIVYGAVILIVFIAYSGSSKKLN